MVVAVVGVCQTLGNYHGAGGEDPLMPYEIHVLYYQMIVAVAGEHQALDLDHE
jgi:hypothetical protein